MQKEKFVKTILAITAAVIMIAIIALFLVSFQKKMVTLLTNMSVKNISETQELYAELLRNKFNDQLKTLDAQAAYFYDSDITKTDEIKTKATFALEIGDFKKVAVVNEDGIAVDLNGKILPNMKNKIYFSDALSTNQIQFSNKIELDENLNPTLVITYPFETKYHQKGVIAGFFSYDVLKQIFSIPIFSGQSYFYLVANDGNILLFNKEKTKNLYNIDIYEYIKNASGQENPEFSKFKIDMLNNQSGCLTLNGGEGQKLFSYAPLGINGWYIMSVLPYTYIHAQQASINRLVFILLIAIIITIQIFVLALSLILRRAIAIRKDNERLTIANNQAQTLIFEYDIPKHTFELSGDTQFILGTSKKDYTIEFVRAEYFPRIHPDDINVLERIKNAIKNNTRSFTAEFRLKNFENNYFWVKMTGSSLFDSSGKVSQFIGSITNVNSQVLHEQELRYIADRDRLSYLLNKNAFERKTREYLEKDGKQNISALFIIDLDNFKDVNDNLGHMTGDLAIKDAAKKLSLIFSDKDYLGRFGGDEFCVLMRFDSVLTKENILKVINAKATDLVRTLKEEYSNEEQTISVTASIGIALFPENGDNYEELFKNADQSVYYVKHHGKDGFKICD